MITHQEYLRTKYFGALDGLRCLSILMVIGFHAQLTCTSFFHTGQYGVSLFFVISGFLITTLLLREQMTSGTISLKNFYIRRTLRIFPLYYATLFIYIALVVLTSHGPERGAFFHNLPWFFTYTNNWFVDKDAGEHVTFAFAWSLATEEQFYLCWPSIVRYAKRWWMPLAIILGAACVDMFFEAGTAHGWIDLGGAGNRIVTSIATPICLGCALAYLLHSPRGFAIARPVLGISVCGAGCVAGFARLLSLHLRARHDRLHGVIGRGLLHSTGQRAEVGSFQSPGPIHRHDQLWLVSAAHDRAERHQGRAQAARLALLRDCAGEQHRVGQRELLDVRGSVPASEKSLPKTGTT